MVEIGVGVLMGGVKKFLGITAINIWINAFYVKIPIGSEKNVCWNSIIRVCVV